MSFFIIRIQKQFFSSGNIMRFLVTILLAGVFIGSTIFAVEPNTLLDIKVIENWQPVKSYEKLLNAEAFYPTK